MAILIQVYGNSLVVVDRHCYLGELFLLSVRNIDAVKEYDRAIKILEK